MVEYSLVAAVACLIGVTGSYLVFPVLENLALKQLTGLVWEGGFHPFMSLPLFAGMIAAMLIVTFVATHLIRNIHPATALRFGLESHSFKKNYLPLDKTNGSLNGLLALKSTLQNKGQNICRHSRQTQIGSCNWWKIVIVRLLNDIKNGRR